MSAFISGVNPLANRNTAGSPPGSSPARGGTTWGAVYDYCDDDIIGDGIYCYKLEDIDFNGKSTLHGPVTATIGRATQRQFQAIRYRR